MLDQSVVVDGEAHLCTCVDSCSDDLTWMLALVEVSGSDANKNALEMEEHKGNLDSLPRVCQIKFKFCKRNVRGMLIK